ELLGTSNVQVPIIWDQILFEIGFAKPWGKAIRFNVNEFAYIEIVAYYAYDNTPFQGSIYMQHKDYSDSQNLFMGAREWNKSVSVPIPPQFPDRPGTTLFLIRNVTSDLWGLNGTVEGQGYRVLSDVGSRWLILRWDRVLIEFIQNQPTFKPGELLNISFTAFYESDGKFLNSSHFQYTLYRDGQEFLSNRSLLYFTDYEMRAINHTYHIDWSIDYLTNLQGSFSSGSNKTPKADISIEWEDIEDPILLYHELLDYGNGTIGFYVEVTDDSPENYFGSGIQKVEAQLTLEGLPPGDLFLLTPYNTSQGLVFYGSLTTDSSDRRNYFGYNELVNYSIIMTDVTGNSISKNFLQYLGADSAAPSTSIVLLEYYNDQDGHLSISVNATDVWSGPSEAKIRYRELGSETWSSYQLMEESMLTNDKAEYIFSSIFNVGTSIEYEIEVQDVVGNIGSIVGIIDITDQAGPQLIGGNFTYSEFGAFNVEFAIGDDGSDIKSVVLRYSFDFGSSWVSVPLIESIGTGSDENSIPTKFQGVFTKKFTLPVKFESQMVVFSLVLTDSEQNERTLTHNELSDILGDLESDAFVLPSIANDMLNNPLVIFILLSFLLGLALLTVQRFRTISGFDKKKVLDELENVSENEVWEENDKVSIGIVASFFDQTKGPVPIIVYPEKLRSSETMLATLADRSFSTLGFVSKPDEDKHATFRFQIGGDRCTVFGYAFAISNPEARGGQENLSVSFVIRPPWGNLENINRFLNELVEKTQQIQILIQENADAKIIQKEMENTRNFFTRAMLTFRRKYKKEFME
ncbi:MAG: hypothetical protein ACW99R_18715, partial [Candidatus Hodarchaeales archaeon]